MLKGFLFSPSKKSKVLLLVFWVLFHSNQQKYPNKPKSSPKSQAILWIPYEGENKNSFKTLQKSPSKPTSPWDFNFEPFLYPALRIWVSPYAVLDVAEPVALSRRS